MSLETIPGIHRYPSLDAAPISAPARALLNTVPGKLCIRLAMEGKLLHPRASQHQSARVRAIVNKLVNEMRGIQPPVESCGKAWTA